ncbi:MAG: ThuA domain-containing protein [Verrucomicrobiaceae bacterium]|nr:ThuA domain-containing protein [Verrucomicrobiaceae bacterium]
MRRFIPLLSLIALPLHAELTAEQQLVPLEVVPAESPGAKIVLLAGAPSNKPGQHEYFAGCALMLEWLKNEAGTAPVMVADGWPRNEALLDGARCVVIYLDGGAKLPFLEPARWARMQKLAEAGTGFVILHQAIDCPPEKAAEFKDWFGAVFQSDIGCRGHWDVRVEHLGTHPVLAGVTAPADFPKDGWLYNLHFAPQGVQPVLTALMPETSRKTADAKAKSGREETIAWAFERPKGGRSFGFTGCDLHSSWAIPQQRRMLVNAIRWCAGLPVNSGGAEITTPVDLKKNLDRKIFLPKKPAKPAQAPADSPR